MQKEVTIVRIEKEIVQDPYRYQYLFSGIGVSAIEITEEMVNDIKNNPIIPDETRSARICHYRKPGVDKDFYFAILPREGVDIESFLYDVESICFNEHKIWKAEERSLNKEIESLRRRLNKALALVDFKQQRINLLLSSVKKKVIPKKIWVPKINGMRSGKK